jgi:hypothetical protein
MLNVGAVGVPSLSKIETWDTEHLLSAARSWTATATLWEESFTTVYQGALRPGGTVWEGEAAEAAQERAFADLVTVRGLSDRLTEAAGIARRGADRLDYLKRDTLAAIERARAAGFTVGEDLSVSDNSPLPVGPALAARQAQAQSFAADIHTRAAALSLADNEIAASIAAAVAPLADVGFEEKPGEGPIHLVSRNIKEGPPIPDPGPPGDPVGKGTGPSAAAILEVTKDLPDGNKSTIKLVQTPEQLRDFFKWASQNGVEVPDAYGPNAGTAYALPDGTRIGIREVAGSTRQPVIDIKYPDGALQKVHVNPTKGGVPKLPTEPIPVRLQPEEGFPSKGFPGEPVPRAFGGMPFETPGMPTLVPPPLPEPETDLPTLGDSSEMPRG